MTRDEQMKAAGRAIDTNEFGAKMTPGERWAYRQGWKDAEATPSDDVRRMAAFIKGIQMAEAIDYYMSMVELDDEGKEVWEIHKKYLTPNVAPVNRDNRDGIVPNTVPESEEALGTEYVRTIAAPHQTVKLGLSTTQAETALSFSPVN